MYSAANLSDLDVAQCRQLVQRKVKRFFGRQLSHHDYEDACSQTMTSVLRKLTRFDPNRGSLSGFLSGAIECSIVDVARHRAGEQQRHDSRCYSLNTPVVDTDGNSADLWQALDERSLQRHRGSHGWPADLVMALQIDFKAAVANMTPEELRLLNGKLAGASNSQLAREFSVCRGTIHRRLVSLRAKFEVLEQYL